MKVILVDNSIDTTGASKSLFNVVHEMRSLGYADFVFVHPKGSRRSKVVEEAGFTSYELPLLEIRRSFIDLVLYVPYLIWNAYKLSRILKKERASIIHLNDMYNMVGICCKLFCTTKLITHVRRMPESFPRVLYNTWGHLHVRFSDKIIAVSNANKNALPNNPKTVVVYNPLPALEKYDKYIPRPLLRKRVSVIYLANYNFGKGHSHAIEMMAQAVSNLPGWDFRMNIFGGDFGMEKNRGYRGMLQELVRSKGLENVIFFHDNVEDVEQAMKAHDVLLNFSDSESFSRVTMESLFYGIPTIATDVGGTKEMVIMEKTGLLVPAKDLDAMAKAFMALITNDKLRTGISANAYLFMREQFSMTATVNKLVEIYKELYNSR